MPEPFDVDGFLYSIAELPPRDRRDRIEDALAKIDAEAEQIRRQLDQAALNGKFDRRWNNAARIALRVKNRQTQRLQQERGEIRKEINDQKCLRDIRDRHTFGKSFMWAAKQLLTGEEYDSIVDLAKRRHKEHKKLVEEANEQDIQDWTDDELREFGLNPSDVESVPEQPAIVHHGAG